MYLNILNKNIEICIQYLIKNIDIHNSIIMYSITIKQNNNTTNITAINSTIYTTTITVANKNIKGKIIFTNFEELKKINCSNNNITDVDDLPNTIEELDCSYNDIEKLDNLPENLIKLYCHNNEIIELNNLPSKIKYLGCSDNKIKSLENLPITLEILNCMFNELTNLDYLPNSIEILYCDNNVVGDNLPSSITVIRCGELDKNKILNLPIKTRLMYY